MVGYSPWGRKESDTTQQLHSLTHHSLGVKVQPLVRELRLHMPYNQNTKIFKKQKQKQPCNKFNKDFLNGPYKKCFKKKKNLEFSPSGDCREKQGDVEIELRW